MTEIDIAGLRALARAAQAADEKVRELTPKGMNVFGGPVSPELMEARGRALRAWTAFADGCGPATVLALCDALEAAEGREDIHKETARLLRRSVADLEVAIALEAAQYREQAREIERLRAIARAACEMAQEGIGFANPLRLGGIINILDGLATGEFDEDTAEWVRDGLSGASDVNHGIMMAVHGPGGVNSQSTAAELRDARGEHMLPTGEAQE